MLRDPLWERKRSALFQLGVKQEGNGSKCVAGEGGGRRWRRAGLGDVLPDGDGKTHFPDCLLLLTGLLYALMEEIDTCPVLE